MQKHEAIGTRSNQSRIGRCNILPSTPKSMHTTTTNIAYLPLPRNQRDKRERHSERKEREKDKKGSRNSDLSSAQDEGKIIIEIREAIASLQLLPDSILIAAGHLGLKKQSTNLLHALLLRLPCVVICHPWLPPLTPPYPPSLSLAAPPLAIEKQTPRSGPAATP
jgi:hypothetical protein